MSQSVITNVLCQPCMMRDTERSNVLSIDHKCVHSTLVVRVAECRNFSRSDHKCIQSTLVVRVAEYSNVSSSDHKCKYITICSMVSKMNIVYSGWNVCNCCQYFRHYLLGGNTHVKLTVILKKTFTYIAKFIQIPKEVLGFCKHYVTLNLHLFKRFHKTLQINISINVR